MNDDSVTEDGGQVLAAWALGQVRMRVIARREWGVFDGEVKGELLYHDPPPLLTRLES